MNRTIDADVSPLSPLLNLRWALALLGVGLSAATCALLMEIPAYHSYHIGFVLSGLWCVGLLAWSLRAVRSMQSKFSITTIIAIATVLAIGVVDVLVAMMIVCLAMVFDVGVVGKTKSWMETTWRSIQVVAGITGLAHASRIIYHWLVN